MLVQHQLCGCGRVDRWRDAARWLGDWPLDWLAMLALQFDNPHVEPFNFLEGDQVYFSQEFDDPGLVAVHSRIIAAAVAGDAVGPSGGAV